MMASIHRLCYHCKYKLLYNHVRSNVAVQMLITNISLDVNFGTLDAGMASLLPSMKCYAMVDAMIWIYSLTIIKLYNKTRNIWTKCIKKLGAFCCPVDRYVSPSWLSRLVCRLFNHTPLAFALHLFVGSFCLAVAIAPSVLWYCWLGLLTCKNRLPYNITYTMLVGT